MFSTSFLPNNRNKSLIPHCAVFDIKISANTLANQSNVGFSEALERLYTDEDSDYEVDDSDDSWGSDSDENEIVAEIVDNTVLFTQNVNWGDLDASYCSWCRKYPWSQFEGVC